MSKQLKYLRGTTIRKIGESVVYTKNNTNTLTIHQNWLSQSCIQDMEGVWNRLEMMEALDDYKNHNLNKR